MFEKIQNENATNLSRKTTAYVFVFFLLINFASTGGHFDSHDGIFYYLVAENMVLNHSIKVDPTSASVEKLEFEPVIKNFVRFWVPESYPDYSNGIRTPFHMPGGAFGPSLAVPWYALSLVLGAEPNQFVAFFTNSFIISLTSLVLFLLGREFFSSEKIGFVVALIFSVTSFIWPYNTTFFLQPPLALTLIVSVYFVTLAEKNKLRFSHGLAGFFLGLSVLIHPSSLIFLPGFLVYSILKFRFTRKLIFYLLAMSITSSLQFFINYLKYGSLIDFGYDAVSTATSHTDWVGLVGLIFSPGWGLIFYFPLSILLPFSFYKMYKYDKKMFFLGTYFFFSTLIFFGTMPTPHWSGFGSWGPRYFVPFLPFASFTLGYLLLNLSKKSILSLSIIGLSICGFIVNLFGSLVWYMTGYGYGWGMEKLLEKSDSFNYFAWVPQYSPIFEHVKVLITDYGGITINPITKTTGCSVDIFLYCTGNIIPFVLLLIFITILTIVILRALRAENRMKQTI